MENVCRVCAKVNIGLMDIFSTLNQEEPCPADMLIDFVDPELQNDDAFPKNICLLCFLGVQKAFELKQKYKQSQEQFKLFLNADNSINLKQLCPNSNVEIQKEIKLEPIDNETISLPSTEVTENCASEEETIEFFKFEEEESKVEDNNSKSLTNFDGNEMIYMGSVAGGVQDLSTNVFDSAYAGIKLTHWCDNCGKGFPSKRELLQHSIAHVNFNQHKCPLCKKVCQSRTSRNHHTIRHKCPHCPKSFVYKGTLKNHIRSHLVPRPGPKRYSCQLCQKKFKTMNLLKKHNRIHSTARPFQCPYCPNRFLTEKVLQTHISTHLNKKEFKCMNCEKTFNYAALLNRHMRYQCKFVKLITGNRTSHSMPTRLNPRSDERKLIKDSGSIISDYSYSS